MAEKERERLAVEGVAACLSLSKTGIRKNSRVSECLVGIHTILFYLFYLVIYILFLHQDSSSRAKENKRRE